MPTNPRPRTTTTHNYAVIAKDMSHGSPAVEAKRLGAFWTTALGGKSVVVFKSDSHLSRRRIVM